MVKSGTAKTTHQMTVSNNIEDNQELRFVVYGI
jgi:hypothetical protein